MLQQPPNKPNDVIDLLIESVQQVVERADENGVMQRVIEPDNESLYFKTQLINSAAFASCVLKLRWLKNLGTEAYYNMCFERAQVIEKQLDNWYKGYKYSFDAKSSETLRDKHNTQSSLIHIMNRNHMERSITLKGEMGKSMMDGIMGRESQKEDPQN